MYESIDEIAGVTDPPAYLDMTVESVTRALANLAKPRWRLVLDRLRR